MKFFGDFYSKAVSIKQRFEVSLPARIHGAEIYDQHYLNTYKLRVYTGTDFSILESWKDGDINGAS